MSFDCTCIIHDVLYSNIFTKVPFIVLIYITIEYYIVFINNAIILILTNS